jgi:hypothetical protein
MRGMLAGAIPDAPFVDVLGLDQQATVEKVKIELG